MSGRSMQFLGQYIGNILTPQGEAHAMLCSDEDRPTELMIHWWGDGINPRAVLFESKKVGRRFELTGKQLFATAENGSLFPVLHPTPEESTFIADIKATLQIKDMVLTGKWMAGNGDSGAITLRNPNEIKEPSDILVCDTWSQFKNWATAVREEQRCSAFRGHGSNKFQLRTSLNRAGKNRLERYCSNELINFASLAEGALETRLDLNNQADYSTILGLAQHHGMPTPLLDWTRSPYIAAFFAFSDALENMGYRDGLTHVRVYAISEDFISTASPAAISVPFFAPYMNFLSISPRLNPRLSAQQGLFLITNVGNIEAFMGHIEAIEGRKILKAVDIPIGLLGTALEDLSYMGLTPATMFPGLDGIGKMMRHGMLFKRQTTLQNTRIEPVIQIDAAAEVTREEGSVAAHSAA